MIWTRRIAEKLVTVCIHINEGLIFIPDLNTKGRPLNSYDVAVRDTISALVLNA